MTAGMGIIHSERASKEFLQNGGTMEGIQLWVNLPASQKMVQPRYQDIKAEQIPEISLDGGAKVRVVAGNWADLKGPALTHTPIVALQLSLPANSKVDIPLVENHQALAYILEGELKLNNNFNYKTHQLVSFKEDGEGISLEGVAEHTEVLILTGEPIGEPVVNYGPFVMNTQTEIMEAMRDYQMGKMGFYVEE